MESFASSSPVRATLRPSPAVLGSAIAPPGFGKYTQRVINGLGSRKYLRQVTVQYHDICTLDEPVAVLAAHASQEIVVGSHLIRIRLARKQSASAPRYATSLSGVLRMVVGDRLDLWAALLLRLPEIVGNLHSQPGLRRAPQRRSQPNREFRAHGRAAVYDSGERYPRHAETLGKIGDRESPVLPQDRVLQNLAGMRRVMHASHGRLSQ